MEGNDLGDDGPLGAHGLDNDHDGHHDDSQMDTTMDSLGGDHLGGSAGPSTQPSSTVALAPGDTVFSNPPSLGLVRQRLFEIEDTIELSAQDFARYWPFVDNVWIRNRAAASTKDANTSTEWYQCRLRKAADRAPYTPKPTPEGKIGRKKRVRDTVSCEMSIKVTRIEGGASSYRIVRGVAKDVKHSHDLDYVDASKRNAGIMDTARREGVKGYQPSSTFHRMWAEPDKMREAGGNHLKISDCRNVTMSWRNENPTVVLKVHDGFSSKVSTGPKPRNSLSTPAKASNSASHSTPYPPSSGGHTKTLAPSVLPQDTLQYPAHAREFLEPYLVPYLANIQSNSQNRNTPHVTLTYASSLDGRIALAPGLPIALSGPESKAMTHYLRSRHDAILIGVGTAIADNPSLNCRLEGAGGYGGKTFANQPRPIIVDPRARLVIHPEMNMLKLAKEGKAKAPWIMIGANTQPHATAVRTLKAHSGEYIKVHHGFNPGPSTSLDWGSIFNILHSEGIKSVMVEGGGRVLGDLLRPQYAHLVDSIIVTVAPTYLSKGGLQVSPDSRHDAQGSLLPTRLRDIKWQPMGHEDVILCGRLADEKYYPRPPGAPAQQPPAAATNGSGLLDGIQEFSQQADGSGGGGPSQPNNQRERNGPARNDPDDIPMPPAIQAMLKVMSARPERAGKGR